MSIEIRDVRRTIGGFTAVDGVSLHVPAGELVALVGPSGSGKTTLLRILAGLDRPDSGTVLFEGEDAASWSARERRVGFVFQHYALFRHLTVFENVAFGLRVRPRSERFPEHEVRQRVGALLDLVQLGWLGDRYPAQLSGGQRQRVALARALAVEPKVLLLDEPFGSLDAAVRVELRRWLRRLHDDLHVTSLLVTHDQEEALEVADRVVVMNSGRIEQAGTPEEVFDRPATPFVMRFLGTTNVFHGRVEGGKARLGPLTVDHPGVAREPRAAAGYVRPHEMEVLGAGEPGGIPAVLRHVNPAGAFVKLELACGDGPLLHAQVSREEYLRLGARSGDALTLRPRNVRVFLQPDDAAA